MSKHLRQLVKIKSRPKCNSRVHNTHGTKLKTTRTGFGCCARVEIYATSFICNASRRREEHTRHAIKQTKLTRKKLREKQVYRTTNVERTNAHRFKWKNKAKRKQFTLCTILLWFFIHVRNFRRVLM